MSNLRLAFAGTPEFAAYILNDLINHDLIPVAVYTQPDRPAGRGRKLVGSAVKACAETYHLPVEQPTTLKHAESQATLAHYQPDILIVVAYGLLLPRAILETPTYGCINVHASLLPRWRGAAPIERAYMAGDEQTGVSIMQMDVGLDTGPVYKDAAFSIGEASIAEVEANLATLGATALRETLKAFQVAHQHHTEPPQPVAQLEAGATYAHKLTAEDRVLDFSQPATQLARQVNALAARMPVRLSVADKRMQLVEATTVAGKSTHPSGSIVGLDKTGLSIQTATDCLLIRKLKFEGGKANLLDGPALKNGYSHLFTPGAITH